MRIGRFGTRHFVIGLVLTALMFGGGALPARAILGVEPPPAPTPGYVQTLVLSMVPATPSVPTPSVPDPNNLQLPQLPYAPVPAGLNPALGIVAPTTVVTCTASYLGPLVGIVALTAALDALPADAPIQPSFINPLFSLTTTACVLAPYPDIATCGPDGNIQSQLTSAPTLPAAGPVPSVDPFAFVPAPFASVVVMAQAVEEMVDHYVYQDSINPVLTNKVAKQLDCKAAV
jgi:hypothetical protein